MTLLLAHLWSVWFRAAGIFHVDIGRLRVKAQVILQSHTYTCMQTHAHALSSAQLASYYEITPRWPGAPKEVLGAGLHRPDTLPVVKPTVSKH